MPVSASWGSFALLSTCACIHSTTVPTWSAQYTNSTGPGASQGLLLDDNNLTSAIPAHVYGHHQSLNTNRHGTSPQNLITPAPPLTPSSSHYPETKRSSPDSPWDVTLNLPLFHWLPQAFRLSLNVSSNSPAHDHTPGYTWTSTAPQQEVGHKYDQQGSDYDQPLWMTFEQNLTSYHSTWVPKGDLLGKLGRSPQRQIASKQAREKVSIIVGLILIPFFSVFGSVGNLMSLRVLSLMRTRMRKVINLVLAALALSDLTFLLHAFFFSFLKLYSLRDPVAGAELRAITFPFLGAYSSVVTARITTGLTVMLSLERLVAVYFPMRARILCSRTVTIAGIALVYGVTILMFVPFLLKYRADHRTTFDNRTVHEVKLTPLGKDPVFFNVYGTVLNTLFRFLPLALLMVANILIALAIRRRNWQPRRTISSAASGSYRTRGGLVCAGSVRSSGGGGGGGGGGGSARSRSSGEYTRFHFKNSSFEQRRITLMLLAVSLVSLVCIMPGAVHSILEKAWVPDYSRRGAQSNLYVILITVSYLLETVNSSVNFIIYMVFSAKFKNTYKNILCCRKSPGRDRGGSARSVIHFSNGRGQHNGNHNGRRAVGGTRFSSSSSSHRDRNRESYLLRHYPGHPEDPVVHGIG